MGLIDHDGGLMEKYLHHVRAEQLYYMQRVLCADNSGALVNKIDLQCLCVVLHNDITS